MIAYFRFIGGPMHGEDVVGDGTAWPPPRTIAAPDFSIYQLVTYRSTLESFQDEGCESDEVHLICGAVYRFIGPAPDVPRIMGFWL